MKSLYTRFVVMGVAAFSTVVASGQEFKPAKEAVVVNPDEGTKAVYDAQREKVEAPSQKADATTPVTAEEQLKNLMKKKNWHPGSLDKGRIFVVETAEFDCESPAADSDFLVKREMKAKEAVLRAKIKIIETINTQMSARDQIDVPGAPLREQFDAKIKEAEIKLKLMKNRLSKLKAYMDKDEADMLAGVTWDDRSKALMDAIIKKIDKQFDTGKISAAKKAKYEKSKAAYLEAKAEMESIEKQAKALNGKIQSEMTSSVSKMAKMPLFGSTVIAQSESWNEDSERYQVAVLVCWSKSLHRAARAIAAGEEFKSSRKKKTGKSIQQWLTEQDLAVMCGPRQYLDGDGNRWYYAVSARALPKASSQRRKAKSLADMFASQMAVYCIYSDLASQKVASQMMQVRNAGDRDDTKVAESMSEKLTQSFKNKTVRGLQQLASRTATHPISGEKIYISVYGINPNAAKASLAAERENYATAVQSEKYQSLERGRADANKAAVDNAKNDRASYIRGRSGQSKAINSIVAKREGSHKTRAYTTAGSKVKKMDPARKSQSGTFTGDSDVADDF